jgi:UDP-N-acetylglucosamine 2-epimerase (non-hydrolysing)
MLKNNSKLKIITIIGTRPEIIRLSRVIAKLDKSFDHVLVHTGQNKDRMMNQAFFEDLEIREPNYYLDIDTSSLGSILGDSLKKIEPIFLNEKPSGVLILGDTNSGITAILAKRMNIPVYHMEAGNRSFDQNVPEEINRKLIDHVSDFNLPYTEHARRNLLAEGLHPRRIALTGSPMREILDFNFKKIKNSKILQELKLAKDGYFLVSAHRQENIDLPERLDDLLDSLTKIHAKWKLPILVSTHPRTRNKLNALKSHHSFEGINFHEPFNFTDYCQLQLNAKCVLSDSGTVSEESAILGFPAVTIRDSMERPEALEFGSIVMSGLKASNIISAIEEVTSKPMAQSQIINFPPGYEIEDCSTRVIRFILSTAERHHEWAGIRTNG